MTRPLYKTTIVIWSEYNPESTVELDDLARDAMLGEAYCSKQESVYVEDPDQDIDAPSAEFFADINKDS